MFDNIPLDNGKYEIVPVQDNVPKMPDFSRGKTAFDWGGNLTEVVSESVQEFLNRYNGFNKIQIKRNFEGEIIANDIYLEEENLKSNSKDGKRYKKGKLAGEELFSADNKTLAEVKKQGKRLPTYSEFRAIVQSKGIKEFIKTCPGYYHNEDEQFCMDGEGAYFLSYSEEQGFHLHRFLKERGKYELFSYCLGKVDRDEDQTDVARFSIRCVKD